MIQDDTQNCLEDKFKNLKALVKVAKRDFFECLDDIEENIYDLKEEIKYTYVPRALDLQQGDIVYIKKDKNIPDYKLGEICTFQAGTMIGIAFELSSPAEGQVISLEKYPAYKKWYQFWIKQEVVGYLIQIL